MSIMNNFTGIYLKLMIDYRLRHTLSKVVSEGGFEKASKKLFITQSAVSRRIYQLESTIGGPVLIRTKPPKPTAIGQRLLNHFQQVLQLELALNIHTTDERIVQDTPLTVKLVANTYSLATWLPEALAINQSASGLNFRLEIITEDQTFALKE